MRDIPVGNGSLLVNFDSKYQIRDIYFPHIGQENHTAWAQFRFGVWIDGVFSWISNDDWERKLNYQKDTLVTDVRLRNSQLGIEIICNDTVASHKNIFLRKVQVNNLKQDHRHVRVFLHQDFRLFENKVGDTAYYDPETSSLIHYQKNRYFLINTEPHFSAFATGRKDFQGQEGTWRDAEDGDLHGGTITEGSVDSTIAVHFDLDPKSTFTFFYWIAAGTSHNEVAGLNSHVFERGPEEYLAYTANYWCVWVNKNDTDLSPLPEKLIDFCKRSLLVVQTQTDIHGAILAANDWEVTERATDHYSYMWTRDGAFVANALDTAGFPHISKSFFRLCSNIVHPSGYFLQKYNSDGSVASGWHSAWDAHHQQPLIPIQEDETALVLWALWEHYARYRDIEFAHRLYRSLVVRCAEFMADFIDPELGLPRPSWNLWEDRRGIHTFTCSTVVAGLRAAANFACLFAEDYRIEKYLKAAETIREAMERHLYDANLGRFVRSLQFHGSKFSGPDPTVDASLFGLFYFGCFSPHDEMVANTMKAVEEKLSSGGGITRFEYDGYMRTSPQSIGNPWFICTLWLAEYYIARASAITDLARAEELLNWVVDRAMPSGILAEQIDPFTGKPLSVSPLTWSHSTFIATSFNYLEKLRQLTK